MAAVLVPVAFFTGLPFVAGVIFAAVSFTATDLAGAGSAVGVFAGADFVAVVAVMAAVCVGAVLAVADLVGAGVAVADLVAEEFPAGVAVVAAGPSWSSSVPSWPPRDVRLEIGAGPEPWDGRSLGPLALPGPGIRHQPGRVMAFRARPRLGLVAVEMGGQHLDELRPVQR